MTEHAKAAKAIREELKKHFPTTKFSVRSKSFSMGDDVRVDWTDGPTITQVKEITEKYQSGNFDAMTDIYEYNNRQNIPQTKYVILQRDMADKTRAAIRAGIEQKYGCDLSNDKEIFDRFHCWPDTLIYRESKDRAF